MKKEFYFKNLKNSLEFQRRLCLLILADWKVLDTKPIGETSIIITCSK